MAQYLRSGTMFKELLGCKRIINNKIKIIKSVLAEITLIFKLMNYLRVYKRNESLKENYDC